MKATVFTPSQVHLLKMFALDKTQKGLEELKSVLFQYYSSRMDNKLNEMWDSGELDQKKLDEINTMDLHKL